MKFTICDGYSSKEIEEENWHDAEQTAKKWGEGGDYPDTTKTFWFEVVVTDEDGDRGSVMCQIDPDEPPCSAREHNWQTPHEVVGGLKEDPGVRGHGEV